MTKKKLLTMLFASLCFSSLTLGITACGDSGETCKDGQHSWTVIDTVAATCQQNGHETKQCSVCNEIAENVLPQVSHRFNGETMNFGDNNRWIPTQTNGGTLYGTCVLCQTKVNTYVPAFSDTAFWTITETPATIVTKGNNTYSCEYGDVVVETEVTEKDVVGYFEYTLDWSRADNGIDKIIHGVTARLTADAPAEVTVPAEYCGQPVSSIYLESQAANVKTLTILGNSVRKVSATNCDSLTTVHFPQTNTTTTTLYFNGCGITDITVPSYVSEYSFQNCNALKNVTIESATDKFQFIDCAVQNALEFPEGVTEITYSKLRLTSNGTKYQLIAPSTADITISNQSNYTNFEIFSKKAAGKQFSNYDRAPIFYDYKETVTVGDYTYLITNQNTATIYKYNGTAQNVVIPSAVNDCNVVSVWGGAFGGANAKSIKSITVPNSVTYIHYAAFSNCSNIESMELPFAGNRIYDDAFHKTDANYNTQYYLPFGAIFGRYFSNTPKYSVMQTYSKEYYTYNSTTARYDYSFESENAHFGVPLSLKTLKINGGQLVEYALKSLQINELTVSRNVTRIEEKCLYDCKSLTTLRWLCTALNTTGIFGSGENTNVQILYNNIPRGATTYTVPSDYTTLTYKDLQGASSLKELIIPQTVTEIEAGALADLTILEKITLPSTGTKYGAIFGVLFGEKTGGVAQFYLGTSEREYAIPTTLTEITVLDGIVSDWYFNGCKNITKANFDTITEIGSAAFEDTGFTSLTLNANLTVLGNSAFANCASLQTVVLPKDATAFQFGETTTIGAMFIGCSSLTELTLPDVQIISSETFDNLNGLTVYYYNDFSVLDANAETPTTLTKEECFGNVTFTKI